MSDQTTKTPVTNFTRTWKVDLYGTWGDGPSASVYMGSHVITLTADHAGKLTAVIDDQPQDTIDRAVGYLEWGRSAGSRIEKLSEAHLTPPAPLTLPAPVIGKGRAHTLHKIMGAAGLPHAQHYGIAAAALGEPWPLTTLSDLTELEARVVWTHLCQQYPSAREIGNRYKARAAAPAHAA